MSTHAASQSPSEPPSESPPASPSEAPSPAEVLNAVMMADDVERALWEVIDSGSIAHLVPELPALRMEQDPIHTHKDVLWHTVVVVGKTRPDLTVRLAALFHDIGKPATRSFEHGDVTFRNHEAVGAKITRKRMKALGYDKQMTHDVSELVRLSGRFKGYDAGWSDSAVRRYARDAGPLLGKLNALVRADCTTRNMTKFNSLQLEIDDLEWRIGELAEQDRRAAERPQIDGAAVMERLGIGPGPQVGEVMGWLLELKRSEGELEEAELYSRLDAYWESIRPPDA